MQKQYLMQDIIIDFTQNIYGYDNYIHHLLVLEELHVIAFYFLYQGHCAFYKIL